MKFTITYELEDGFINDFTTEATDATDARDAFWENRMDSSKPVNHIISIQAVEYSPSKQPASPEVAGSATPQPAAPLLNRETFLSPLTQLACAISQLSNDRFHEKLIISVADAEKLVNGYGFTFTAAPASPPSQETK